MELGAWFILFVLIAGRISEETPSETTTSLSTTTKTASFLERNELEFETISDRYWCDQGREAEYVIKSRDEWQSAWGIVQECIIPPPDLPYVDFKKSMVIGYFYGSGSPSESVRITKVLKQTRKSRPM